MKIESKKYYLLLLFFVFVSGIMLAQRKTSFYDNSNNSEFIIVPKIGFAVFKESGNIPLNGFVNGGDIILSLKLNRKLNLSTGLGFLEFNGNRNIEGNTASLKNSYLHIPLHLKSDFVIVKDNPLNRTVFLELGFGLYSNCLIKREIVTVDNFLVDKNDNWNFGLSGQLGVKFILSEVFNFGIGFETQNDLSKNNHNNGKIESQNTIFLLLGIAL